MLPKIHTKYFKIGSKFCLKIYLYRRFILTCMITAKTIPNASWDRRGTTANHTRDDTRNESSQANAAAIMMMMRTGSLAMVSANIAKGAPNASNEQLKNSARVIFVELYTVTIYSLLYRIYFADIVITKPMS